MASRCSSPGLLRLDPPASQPEPNASNVRTLPTRATRRGAGVQVAFVNSPRDFIGAAAKSLGLPYNVTPDSLRAAHVSEEQLAERVRALRGQCRSFRDSDVLAALKGRDVWAAVCPCDSAALVAARSTRLTQVVPASGTGLFADVWVQPRRAGGTPFRPLPQLPAAPARNQQSITVYRYPLSSS